uniref:EF-hand domain-containing protein n=1 Tax=Accipiter nisus TaxID=211598 RepID=A0A8B9MEF2_9AVES
PSTDLLLGWGGMALKTIVDVYHRYSIREGQLDLLNFNDFRTLLTENKREYLRKLFEETDLNKDSELTFEEFTIVLAKLTDDAHRISHRDDHLVPG